MSDKRIISIVPHEQWQSAICARCSQPGHCCSGFNLSKEDGHPFVYWDDERPVMHNDYPFVPLHRWNQWTVEGGPDVGRTYSAWRWACTKLVDGKCSIYSTRPELCRSYEPLTDHLCVMTKG